MIYTIYPCPISFCPSIILHPPPLYHFAPIIPPWKSLNDLHYILMPRIILPPWFILPLYHFAPYCFAPGFILPPLILPPGNDLLIYTIYPCPISILRYMLMSCIILPPWFILPPIILPPSFCPLEMVNWFTLFTHVPYHFAPLSFCPLIILHPPPENCLLISTIYPCPVSFCPLDSFCPPGNDLLIYTIYPCPISFCSLH